VSEVHRLHVDRARRRQDDELRTAGELHQLRGEAMRDHEAAFVSGQPYIIDGALTARRTFGWAE
jgi:hypothetical protein